MHDLKRLEEKFHEFIGADDGYDKSEIRITEELLERKEMLYIPFGYMTYFLVIEDEKPVLYVRAVSRMDLNSICFVDEEGFRCHDVFMPESNEGIREKYKRHARNVKRSWNMKGLPKARIQSF